MEQRICLNCNEEAHKRFCANCGQRTDTQRITFAGFIAHDLLHGTFHLDRGILFTIKDALRRPGQSARDYIYGKRIRYYNVFYLSLILIGLTILLSHTGESTTLKGGDATSQEFVEFFTSNIKLILLGFVPLLALNGCMLLRKTKFNLAEHFIAAGFTFVGILALLTLMMAVNAFIEITNAGMFFEYILLTLMIFVFLFPIWAYGSLCWKHYSLLGLAWRMVVFYLLLTVEIILLAGIAIWLVTGSSDLIIN